MQTAQLLPPAPAELVADADITAAIKTLLATKKGLTAHRIAVQTRAGIVALTGYTRQEDRRRALAVGFDDHVGKPLDTAAIDRALLAVRAVAPRT